MSVRSSLSFLILVSFCICSAIGVDFRFIVMADSRGSNNGVNTAELQTIMARVKNLNPQPLFMVFPGDMINGSNNSYSVISSQLKTWKDTMTAYYPASFYYLGVGNHETNNGNSASQAELAFQDLFSEFTVADQMSGYNKTAYSFDYDNSRFIMLNTNHINTNHIIDSNQRAWLQSKLTGKTHYFIFFHEPAYPTGDHVGSSLDVNAGERDAFWQILDNANITIAFVGHEHFYTRRHINSANKATYNHSIYQATVGSCGASLYSQYNSTLNVDVPPISAYQYGVVDVSGNNVTANIYKDDGTTLDTFSAIRGVPVQDWFFY